MEPQAPAIAVRLDRGVQLVAPDAVGMSVLDAHTLARDHGLRIAISLWQTKIGPWGLVLSQDPQAGSIVSPGRRIHVVVAGRPHLAVPDVRGLHRATASDVLRRLGLQPEVSLARGSGTVPDGDVITTQPRAGSLVPDGSRVKLEVSRGPSDPG